MAITIFFLRVAPRIVAWYQGIKQRQQDAQQQAVVEEELRGSVGSARDTSRVGDEQSSLWSISQASVQQPRYFTQLFAQQGQGQGQGERQGQGRGQAQDEFSDSTPRSSFGVLPSTSSNVGSSRGGSSGAGGGGGAGNSRIVSVELGLHRDSTGLRQTFASSPVGSDISSRVSSSTAGNVPLRHGTAGSFPHPPAPYAGNLSFASADGSSYSGAPNDSIVAGLTESASPTGSVDNSFRTSQGSVHGDDSV